MTGCSRYCAAEARFDKKVAQGDLRRYRRRGAEAITRILLEEVRRWPLHGKQLLDVGCGIGIISAELAGDGLAGATLVDASPSYLEVAQGEVPSRYAPRPTQFFVGDFSRIAGTLSDADVVTLDRVVCCYPDDEALLGAAASRTRHLLAFTYPQDRWYVRAFIGFANFSRQRKGCAFRAFIHPQQRMCATLEAAGLVRVARRETPVWILDVYRRS